MILHVPYIALYQNCSNDSILLYKSASRAKNSGEQSRATLVYFTALIYIENFHIANVSLMLHICWYLFVCFIPVTPVAA